MLWASFRPKVQLFPPPNWKLGRFYFALSSCYLTLHTNVTLRSCISLLSFVSYFVYDVRVSVANVAPASQFCASSILFALIIGKKARHLSKINWQNINKNFLKKYIYIFLEFETRQTDSQLGLLTRNLLFLPFSAKKEDWQFSPHFTENTQSGSIIKKNWLIMCGSYLDWRESPWMTNHWYICYHSAIK